MVNGYHILQVIGIINCALWVKNKGICVFGFVGCNVAEAQGDALCYIMSPVNASPIWRECFPLVPVMRLVFWKP